MKVNKIIFLFVLLCSTATMQAQTTEAKAETTTQKDTSEPKLVQLSGLLLTELNGELVPVPYGTVYLPEKNRGTYCDFRGFFNMVAEPGDVVRFSAVGFKNVAGTVPDTLSQDRYSLVQLISGDTTLLPEMVVFPWPSRDHFRLEFLKMDVTPELQRRAAENVANDYLAEVRNREDAVPFSGKEGAKYYMRQQSKEYTYIGQVPPMNIFSPLAWGQFFKAWKDGDFKKKKKNE